MSVSKIVAAAASGVNKDPGLDVDNVFSTQVYTGDNTTRLITNQISLGNSYLANQTFDGTQTSPTTITPNLGSISTWEVSFFFKCTDISVGNQWIISTNQGYSNSSPKGFLIGLYNAPGYLALAIAGSNFGAYGFVADTAIVQDRIYHCVVNYQSGTIKMFLDGAAQGASIGSTSIGSGSVTWDSVDLGIGRSTSGGAYGQPFKGSFYGVTVTSNITRSSNFGPPTLGSFGATVDEAGSGGLVWTKSRSNSLNNALVDTEQGEGKYLVTNATSETRTDSYAQETIVDFNIDGYKLARDTGSDTMNRNGYEYVSWTFRKAKKFFDVVKYSGTGSKRTVSHNLGSTPGMIIIKRINANGDNWDVWHRSLGGSGNDNNYVQLNSSNAASGSSRFGVYGTDDPTSTTFTVKNQSGVNASGGEYIAYLFAHNNNDGGFGPNNSDDIIKCGSYTGNSSASGPSINLGFEPQWVIIKKADNTENWYIYDSMRGVITGPHDNGLDRKLIANSSSGEGGLNSNDPINFGSTGFNIGTTDNELNNNGSTYIYMAIRRGSLNVPTDATKVFHANFQGNANTFSVGFPTDFAMVAKTGGSSSNAVVGSRLTGDSLYLVTNDESAEAASSSIFTFDLQNSFKQGFSTSANNISWLWKRARGYFDVSCYTGTGSYGLTVNHNLGVVPEMIWVKQRTSNNDDWFVYHSALGNTKWLELNENTAEQTHQAAWNNTSPTATQFTVGAWDGVNGSSSAKYIAYLFATVDGVSKVGSFSHTNGGGDTNVDCGFSSGARFVMCKRSSDTGSWYIFDSVRGINGGNDPHLELNSSGAQVTGSDVIDPLNSGFTVASGFLSSGTYIFYAIA